MLITPKQTIYSWFENTFLNMLHYKTMVIHSINNCWGYQGQACLSQIYSKFGQKMSMSTSADQKFREDDDDVDADVVAEIILPNLVWT